MNPEMLQIPYLKDDNDFSREKKQLSLDWTSCRSYKSNIAHTVECLSSKSINAI